MMGRREGVPWREGWIRQNNTARLGHQSQTSRNRRPPPQTRW